MRAYIISIGDELLCGDTINTNATWIAKQLCSRGVEVRRIMVIPDDVDEIAGALKDADADIIIITGGLGPTHDDITRFGIAKGVDDVLVRNEEALEFMRRAYEVSEDMEQMAYLPSRSTPLLNPVGSAPGFFIEEGGRKIFVLPGVPAEMEAMFEYVLPHLHGRAPHIRWVVSKKPEAEIASVMREALERFSPLKIGSYPRGGQVRIRLSSNDPTVVEEAKRWLESRV